MAATTLTRMMKKTISPSVIPLVNRRTPHRNYTSDLFNTRTTIGTSNSTSNLYTQISRATTIPTHHHISAQAKKQSISDDPFRVVDSQIDFAEEKFPEAAELLREFTFKIDCPVTGKPIITLTREYNGEKIEVTAWKSDFSDDELSMKITVRKKSTRNLTFHVESDADGTRIDLLTLFNPNPSDDYIHYRDPDDFSAFSKELQEAFCTYLEVRGIKPSIVKFLCECLDQRKHTKHTEQF
ncbi:uncharacterized protein LOC113311781 [Papaver somniferum]|uniref:uncharacterized protein LOC113311781 n=1 Tax=Papaver somniferum TaxID=3469 RepID=UPI000E700192|nr:uncharacterized protein LOC113311781 [Papaver somniferum]